MMPTTLLVVEDDPLVMLSAATALEENGWIVKKAANGAVAMDRLKQLSDSVDALVIDIRLGQGPSGWEVANFARSIRPNIPVAYMTGDLDAPSSDEKVQGGIVL